MDEGEVSYRTDKKQTSRVLESDISAAQKTIAAKVSTFWANLVNAHSLIGYLVSCPCKSLPDVNYRVAISDYLVYW